MQKSEVPQSEKIMAKEISYSTNCKTDNASGM